MKIEIESRLHKINLPNDLGLKISLQKADYQFKKLQKQALKKWLHDTEKGITLEQFLNIK